MPDNTTSPLNAAVSTLIERSHDNGDRITLTDVATYLGLDVAATNEEGKLEGLDEASEIAALEDDEQEKLQEKLDIGEVLSALKDAGIEVSDEVDEARIEDDIAYLEKQAVMASVAGGELDAHSLLLKDLGNHAILTREEETERTTRIALLNRTVRELAKSRDRVAKRLVKAQEEQTAKKELLDLLLDDSEMDKATRELLSAEPQGALDAAAAVVARYEGDLVNINNEISEAEGKAKVARDEFLSYNYRLVLYSARKIHQQSGPRVDFNDLVMQGVYGMIEAIGKFDPTRGYKFSTFATWHIRQKISEFSHEQKGAIRVPTHRHRDIRKMSRHRADFFSENGRNPTDIEMAAFMGKTVEKIAEIYNAEILASPGSIDAPLSTESDAGSLGEILPDLKALSPEDVAVREAISTTLRAAFMRVLDTRERRVLQLRFGLYDEARAWTLEEVGQRLGVTRERVRQIEAKALKKMEEDNMVRELDDQPPLPPRPTRRARTPIPPAPRRRMA